MSRTCRECQRGHLKIIGMGGYDDTIIVECPHCGEEYEVEPDGLGEGGLEMVEAFEIENGCRDEDDGDDDTAPPSPIPIPE